MRRHPTSDRSPQITNTPEPVGVAARTCDNCGTKVKHGYLLIDDSMGEFVGEDCCTYFKRVVTGRECQQCKVEFLGKSSYGIDPDGNVCPDCIDGVVKEPIKFRAHRVEE